MGGNLHGSNRDVGEASSRPVEPSAVALVALLAVAVPLLLHAARAQSFWPDELLVFTTRDLTEPGSWYEPWAGHWATVPIVLVSLLYATVELRSYVPYAGVAITAHLMVVAATWACARRLEVAGWVATVGVVPLVVLGSGRDNIFSAFQTSLTLALAFGLAQLLLATSATTWSRRDVAGLALGFLALMCSGVAIATTAGVAVAVGIRRGRAIAAAHVAPLAVTYLVWAVLVPDDGTRPGPTFGLDVLRFTSEMLKATLGGLGRSEPAAVGIAVLAGAGAAATFTTALRRTDRSLLGDALGLATVGATMVLLTGVARGGGDLAWATEARYVHIVAALLVPWVLAGVEALRRRQAWVALVAFGVLLIGVPANVEDLDDVDPSLVSPLLRSDYLATADADRLLHPLLPLPVHQLQDAARWTDVPDDLEIPADQQRLADVMLALTQRHGPPTAGCPVARSQAVRLERGGAVAISGPVAVTVVERGAPASPVPYLSTSGTELVATAPIHVRVTGLERGAGVARC